MIPEDRLSSSLVSADLVNPWSANRALSYHMGPVQLQDPSEGMLVKLWQARIIRSGEDELSLKEIALFAPGMEEVIRYVHTENIREVSLAFDQNANPYFAFVTESGIPFLRWFDPTVESMVNLELDGSIVTPRITLDDVRSFNSSNSDVILAYVRAGLLRYRKQRDRWLTEYTPTQGVGGDPAEMQFLKHVSMNSALRLEFVSGDEEDPYIFLEAITDFDRTPDNKTALTAILENDLYYGTPVKLEDLDDLPKITRAPIIGTVSVNPDGTTNFTPPRGFRGVISFEYEIKASPLGED